MFDQQPTDTVTKKSRASQVFGIDKSISQVSKAAARHQLHNLSFHHIEAWDLNSVLKLTEAAGVKFTVVFIDVSGSRRVGDVDNLIMKYEQVRQGNPWGAIVHVGRSSSWSCSEPS